MTTVVLCILDGWGISPQKQHNGIYDAHTPNYDRFLSIYSNTFLEASQHDVGLPDHQMGNSEVGHMNIGAGRIIMQDLPRINDAIKNNQIRTNRAYEKLKHTTGVVHLMGLLSDGGVHSHINHIIEIASLLKKDGRDIVLHAFLDGRDTSPKSAKKYIQQIVDHDIKIASIGGRYYGMDRDQRWDRIEKSFNAINAQNSPFFTCPLDYIDQQYAQNITDEFIMPAIAKEYQGFKKEDALLVMNFRADRMRQILEMFKEKNHLFGLTEYSQELSPFMTTFFPPEPLKNTLGEVVANSHLNQLRLAETEKYAHVTFFFNGGKESVFEGEDRILIESPKVATYDLQPEMSADQVCENLITAIESKKYHLIVVNFANADMVGHTGIESAITIAIEKLDDCLGKIEESILKMNGVLIITADHGNAEETFDETTHQPHTAHTLNPVPLILIGKNTPLRNGKLCDIAPTILKLMNLNIPQEMTGDVLI